MHSEPRGAYCVMVMQRARARDSLTKDETEVECRDVEAAQEDQISEWADIELLCC